VSSNLLNVREKAAVDGENRVTSVTWEKGADSCQQAGGRHVLQFASDSITFAHSFFAPPFSLLPLISPGAHVHNLILQHKVNKLEGGAKSATRGVCLIFFCIKVCSFSLTLLHYTFN